MKHLKKVLLTYSRIILLDCQEQTILRGHKINSCVTNIVTRRMNLATLSSRGNIIFYLLSLLLYNLIVKNYHLNN